MSYVSATLTQLSTRTSITIKARGKRITQAVDVSLMIVKRMEDLNNIDFRANGFPDELIDNEVEEKGYEI